MQKIIFTPLYMVLFLYENTIYCGHFSKSSILGQPPRKNTITGNTPARRLLSEIRKRSGIFTTNGGRKSLSATSTGAMKSLLEWKSCFPGSQ